jgi:phospholipase/carboxylesterase
MLAGMALDTLDFQSGDHPVASLIVLHGLGADGNDFVPIARELDLSAVGPMRFVFPHAPIRPVTINGGMKMRAWYDIYTPDLVRREDEAGLRASVADVQALIDREAALGIPPERVVLMGFSQGCAVALLAGLRAPQRLAGIAGLSGYLPSAAPPTRTCRCSWRMAASIRSSCPRAVWPRARRCWRWATASSGTTIRWSTRSARKKSRTSTSGC